MKARNYEVGVPAQPWPWLDARLSFYRTDVIDDIFSVAPTGTVGLFFQNVGDTRRQGVEVALRGKYGRLVEPWRITRTRRRRSATRYCAAPPCTQVVRKGSDLASAGSGCAVTRPNAERWLGDYAALNASLSARVKAPPVQRFLTPASPIGVHGGLAWRF